MDHAEALFVLHKGWRQFDSKVPSAHLLRAPVQPVLPQALQIGARATRLISAAFPEQMELKFEKMCLPFMLLHVNR